MNMVGVLGSPTPARATDVGLSDHNRLFLKLVADFVISSESQALFFNLDAVESWQSVVISLNRKTLVLLTRSQLLAKELIQAGYKVVNLPAVALTRRGEARAALTIAVLKDYAQRKGQIIFVSGSDSTKTLDTLMILEPQQELKVLQAKSLKLLGGGIQPEVFETVLTLALELAHEGREGKPVGTMFVIGDTQNVLRLSHQMVLNPFKGYPDEAKNILDPSLKESIREFATLDGAFVIRRNGVVLAAGRHIATMNFHHALQPGLGTRHMAAAAITHHTKAVAITISESTGTVRAFRHGEIFLELEKPSA
ncbi:DNA integrity scanning protein DisA nucleotide-binding domain protein [Candidatus Acetothermia bacterium]|nr:DNA integrity scanning protein DisA nucleotide-binding domain protein [Candidatus Acetothermia bacterium]